MMIFAAFSFALLASTYALDCSTVTDCSSFYGAVLNWQPPKAGFCRFKDVLDNGNLKIYEYEYINDDNSPVLAACQANILITQSPRVINSNGHGTLKQCCEDKVRKQCDFQVYADCTNPGGIDQVRAQFKNTDGVTTTAVFDPENYTLRCYYQNLLKEVNENSQNGDHYWCDGNVKIQKIDKPDGRKILKVKKYECNSQNVAMYRETTGANYIKFEFQTDISQTRLGKTDRYPDDNSGMLTGIVLAQTGSQTGGGECGSAAQAVTILP